MVGEREGDQEGKREGKEIEGSRKWSERRNVCTHIMCTCMHIFIHCISHTHSLSTPLPSTYHLPPPHPPPITLTIHHTKQDKLESVSLQQKLELEIDGSTMRQGELLGYITVSVVFRPCDSVSRAELPSMATVTVADGMERTSPSAVVRSARQVGWGGGRGGGRSGDGALVVRLFPLSLSLSLPLSLPSCRWSRFFTVL